MLKNLLSVPVFSCFFNETPLCPHHPHFKLHAFVLFLQTELRQDLLWSTDRWESTPMDLGFTLEFAATCLKGWVQSQGHLGPSAFVILELSSFKIQSWSGTL